MRTKKVNRYYCDFCKKAGCSGGHIKKHERGCTKNPERICGICKAMQAPQVPILELMAFLPEPRRSIDDDGCITIHADGLEEAVERLRQKTESCPACMMAALRQKGIPVPMAETFHYKSALDDIWKDINEAGACGNYG